MTKGNKDEAAALVAVLQSPSEASEARCSACEAVLNLSKSDVTCAVLCSVGGIHAVVNAVKEIFLHLVIDPLRSRRHLGRALRFRSRALKYW